VLTWINNSVSQKFLSTPWILSTAYVPSSNSSGIESRSMTVNSTGSRAYFAKETALSQWTATTPYNLNTISYDKIEYSLGILTTGQISIYNTNNKMLMSVTNKIRGYTFNTASQLNTLRFRDTNVYSFNPEVANPPRSFDFNSDGSILYIQDWNNGIVYQYALSSNWNINTLNYSVLSKSVVAQNTRPTDLAFKSDDTKYYMLGNTNIIYQYTVGTPGNISTATYDTVLFNFSGSWAGNTIVSFAFNDTGTKLYALSSTTETVREYSLGTPWDISTLVYGGVNLDISGEIGVNTFQKITFTEDGIYMLVLDSGVIYRYDLITPWDLSTASWSGLSWNITQEDPSGFYGIRARIGEGKLWVNGKSKLGVFQYNLTT
jgi:hypothetical protein